MYDFKFCLPACSHYLREMFEIPTKPLATCWQAFHMLLVPGGPIRVSLGDIKRTNSSKLKNKCPSDQHHRALNRSRWTKLGGWNSPKMMVRLICFEPCVSVLSSWKQTWNKGESTKGNQHVGWYIWMELSLIQRGFDISLECLTFRWRGSGNRVHGTEINGSSCS